MNSGISWLNMESKYKASAFMKYLGNNSTNMKEKNVHLKYLTNILFFLK